MRVVVGPIAPVAHRALRDPRRALAQSPRRSRSSQTPDEVVEVTDPPPAPDGVDWDRLPEEALGEMPVLTEPGELARPRRSPGRS